MGAAAALVFVFYGDMLWRTPKAGAPITSKAKAGFLYAGLFLIGLGVVNLLNGFIRSEMFVSGRYGGYVGMMSYAGHRRAFAFLGIVYWFMTLLGVGIIRIYVFGRETK